MEFTIELATPQDPRTGAAPSPLPGLRFTVPQTSVRLRTNLNGYLSADIGFPYTGPRRGQSAYLPKAIEDYRPQGHVVISDGVETIFEGRMGPQRRQSGQVLGFTARGYQQALSDQVYSNANEAVSTSGLILRGALRDLNPYVRIGNSEQYQDPGRLHAYLDFDNLTPGEMARKIAAEGGTDAYPWDVAIWSGLTAWLTSREPPSAPLYVVPDDETVDLTYDPEEFAARVQVAYTVSGTSHDTEWYPLITTSTVYDRYGIWRTPRLEGGQMTLEEAEWFRNTYYTEHSTPRWSGTINRDATRGLERYDGSEEQRHRVRAGQWVRIVGLPSAESLLLITETEWDSERDTLRVQVGPGRVTGADLFRNQQRDLAALRSNRSPLTYARQS